jgi:predicted outer membrane lipoprotein
LRRAGHGHNVRGLADGAGALRIAKPILLVTTPVGVAWGIVEAWRFHWWLAVLMAALVGVIGAFAWLTVSRIRRERDATGHARPPEGTNGR